MFDGHVASRFVGESSRRRDQVEKVAIANRREGTAGWLLTSPKTVMACEADSSTKIETCGPRTKASILQPLLDQLLRFIASQVGDINIVNQGQVDVPEPLMRVLVASSGTPNTVISIRSPMPSFTLEFARSCGDWGELASAVGARCGALTAAGV